MLIKLRLMRELVRDEAEKARHEAAVAFEPMASNCLG